MNSLLRVPLTNTKRCLAITVPCSSRSKGSIGSGLRTNLMERNRRKKMNRHRFIKIQEYSQFYYYFKNVINYFRTIQSLPDTPCLETGKGFVPKGGLSPISYQVVRMKTNEMIETYRGT